MDHTETAKPCGACGKRRCAFLAEKMASATFTLSAPVLPPVESILPTGEEVAAPPLTVDALVELQARHSESLMGAWSGKGPTQGPKPPPTAATVDGDPSDPTGPHGGGSSGAGSGTGVAGGGSGGASGGVGPATAVPRSAAAMQSLLRAHEEVRQALDLFGLTLGSDVKIPKLFQVGEHCPP